MAPPGRPSTSYSEAAGAGRGEGSTGAYQAEVAAAAAAAQCGAGDRGEETVTPEAKAVRRSATPATGSGVGRRKAEVAPTTISVLLG